LDDQHETGAPPGADPSCEGMDPDSKCGFSTEAKSAERGGVLGEPAGATPVDSSKEERGFERGWTFVVMPRHKHVACQEREIQAVGYF